MLRLAEKSHEGFTLMEMLIVVAIIAVLVAIAIPVFANQLARARAATDMANVRSAEAAATTKFMTDNPGVDTTYYFDAAGGTVTTDSSAVPSIKGYGQSTVAVDGSSGIPNEGGAAKFVAVTVQASGSYSAMWMSAGGDPVLNAFEDLAAQVEASYNGKYHSGTDLISAAMEKNGGLPQTTGAALASLLRTSKLTSVGADTVISWRPLAVKVNGVTTTVLYANNGTSVNGNWQAYAFYYDGHYYASTNTKTDGSGNTAIDRNGTGTISSFLTGGNNSWVKVG